MSRMIDSGPFVRLAEAWHDSLIHPTTTTVSFQRVSERVSVPDSQPVLGMVLCNRANMAWVPASDELAAVTNGREVWEYVSASDAVRPLIGARPRAVEFHRGMAHDYLDGSAIKHSDNEPSFRMESFMRNCVRGADRREARLTLPQKVVTALQSISVVAPHVDIVITGTGCSIAFNDDSDHGRERAYIERLHGVVSASDDTLSFRCNPSFFANAMIGASNSSRIPELLISVAALEQAVIVCPGIVSPTLDRPMFAFARVAP